MGCSKENAVTAKILHSGEKCIIQGFGQSMEPTIKSGQRCEVTPVMDDTVLEKNDISSTQNYSHKETSFRPVIIMDM